MDEATASSRTLACVLGHLEKPLASYPPAPEKDARLMRWRNYGTGAAMCMLLDRLVIGWKQQVASGMSPDVILARAVAFIPQAPRHWTAPSFGG